MQGKHEVQVDALIAFTQNIAIFIDKYNPLQIQYRYTTCKRVMILMYFLNLDHCR